MAKIVFNIKTLLIYVNIICKDTFKDTEIRQTEKKETNKRKTQKSKH